jgi:hypothetical protein
MSFREDAYAEMSKNSESICYFVTSGEGIRLGLEVRLGRRSVDGPKG